MNDKLIEYKEKSSFVSHYEEPQQIEQKEYTIKNLEQTEFEDSQQEYINDLKEISIRDDKKRTLCAKYFSKMDPGSLRSSIFSLSILAIGVGCLALPQKFGQLSLALCSIQIVIAAISTYWTINLIIEAGRKKGLTVYSHVIEEFCGRNWAIFFDVVIIIYVFGVLITYQIIIYKLVGSFIYMIFYLNDYPELDLFYTDSFWNRLEIKIGVMMGTALIFLMPLNLLKDISKLRFSSILGIFSLGVFVIVLCFQLKSFIDQYYSYEYKENDESTHINWYDASKAFGPDVLFFKATATIFFAYNCHYGAFPVYDKLADNNERRTNKVVYRSIILDTVFFLIVGICGYLTQPIKTPDLIIFRNQLFDDKKDIVMTICRIFITILLITKTPVNFNSMRLSLFNLVFKSTQITTRRNLLFAIPITFITALIGALYSDVENILSFLGGICGVIFSYFFPAFIYVRSNDHKRYHIKNIITVGICGIFSIIGLIAGGFSIKTIITGNAKGGH